MYSTGKTGHLSNRLCCAEVEGLTQAGGEGGIQTLEPGRGAIFRLELRSRVSFKQFDAIKSPV